MSGYYVWIIERALDDFLSYCPDRFGIDMVTEKISNHLTGACHGESAKNNPILWLYGLSMQSHVRASRLFPRWYRELVHIGPQVSDLVQARR
jgi:hypothetical protein